MKIREVLPPDAIPSIDAPEFGTEYIGNPDDLVIAIDATPPRAYPIRILEFHEIVNDTIATETGDIPVAVTWCPLCGSAIVYDRRVDNEVLTFGVSGKLADDDLVMYDRETGSEWKQSRGACHHGPLAGSHLDPHPFSMISWEKFCTDHSGGLVLQPTRADSEVASDTDEPAPIDYNLDPYEAYLNQGDFGLGAHRHGRGDRSWDRTDLAPKSVVLGIERDGDVLGFPVTKVQDAGSVVRATVGATRVVVFAAEGELHAYEDPGIDFYIRNGIFFGDGARWDPTTGYADDGRRLTRLPARRLFAFTWQDDHGSESFYSPEV